MMLACRKRMVLVFLLVSLGAFCAAEGTPPAPAAAEPSAVDSLQEQIRRIEKNEDISDALRTRLTGLYQEVLVQLQACQEWAKKAADFDAVMQSGPDEIAKLQAQTLEPPPPPSVDVPKDATVSHLEQLLSEAGNALNGAKAARTALEEELGRRDDRRKELPELIDGAKQRIEESQKAYESSKELTEETEVLEAVQALETARQQTIQEELDAYAKELQSYDVRGQLMKLRLDDAVLDVANKEKRVETWEAVVSAAREEEARKAAEQARVAVMDAAKASPKVREFAGRLAAENVELVNRRTGPEGLLSEIERTSDALQTLEGQLTDVKSDFARVSQKVETLGSNTAIGLLLRQSKDRLPDPRQLRGEIRNRQDEIARVQIERMNLGEKRSALGNIEKKVKESLSQAEAGTDPQQQRRLEASLRGLLHTQRDTLDMLIQDYDREFEKLVDADSRERELASETEKFTGYIAERVLWIRSGPPLGWADVATAWAALGNLAVPARWEAMWAGVPRTWNSDLIACGAALLALLLALASRGRLIARLDAAGIQAKRSACVSFRPSLRAMLLTVLLSAPLPVTLWVVGLQVSASAYASETLRAAGAALQASAAIVLLFSLARQIMRPNGVAEAHFEWPAKPMRTVSKHLQWLACVAVLASFLHAMLEWNANENVSQVLGRWVYLGILGAFLVFAHIVLRPTKGAIPLAWNLIDPARPNRHRYVLYGAAVTAPLLLATLAIAGYFYTAYQLGVHVFTTLCFALGLLMLRGFILRWLFLARRRLAMQQACERRELTRNQDGAPQDEVLDEDEHKAELARIDVQTSRLIRSLIVLVFLIGTWAAWANVLPALRVLNHVELWRTVELQTQAAPNGADDKKTVESRQVVVAVTVGDLVLAVVLASLTLIATANVPGLLDLTILKRMHYLKGERYAITAMVRYAIITIGVIATFHAIGIGWSKVQWLVAALGVGLGFGLQEIFANFVSGLIILIERPVRVGDVVTVGGVTGTVSRIRTRATWITDANRKELIVPNKEFVTQHVLNWTLSDSVLRVVVSIGVAYDSVPERVEELMLSIARQHPNVLLDPAPTVAFTGFGDSALNFDLRVYCSDVDLAGPLQNTLSMAILKAFRDAGIEMPFPQHDIHVRTFTTPPQTPEPPKEET